MTLNIATPFNLLKCIFTESHIHLKKLDVSSQLFCSSSKLKRGEKIDEKYDIVISGGGMVGFAAACALGQSPRLADKPILLLEMQPKREWKLPTECSNRVCALNAQTRHLLSQLGAWEKVEEMRAHPVHKMQVWDSLSEAMITFSGEREDPLSHIVENDVILAALKGQVPRTVKVWYGGSVESYDLPGEREREVIITMKDGRTLAADLLIGADGIRSSVRQAMGQKDLSIEYDQAGIVATLILEEEQDNNVAWQKFLPTGPIAVLPVSRSRSSVVWSTIKSEAEKLVRLPEEQFVDALNEALWESSQEAPGSPLVRALHSQWDLALRGLCPPEWGSSRGPKQLPPSFSGLVPGSRAKFPLGLGHAPRYVGPGVALVGDAAHRVHPLAGQGVNLGMGDVTCLLKALEDNQRLGNTMGDALPLRRAYETPRQRYNVSTQVAVHSLQRLYSTALPPLVLLRSLGLSFVDAVKPLKDRIMRQQLQTIDLPTLFRVHTPRILHSSVNFSYSKPCSSPSEMESPEICKPCSASIIWSSTLAHNSKIEVSVAGKRLGTTRKNESSPKSRVSICRVEMLRKVFQLFERLQKIDMNSTDLKKLCLADSSLSYNKVKQLSDSYKNTWKLLCDNVLIDWTKKPEKIRDFVLDGWKENER